MPSVKYFESGQIGKARAYVDSVFYQLKVPTVYDYLSHYNTNAYYYGTIGNTTAQITYLDSAIQLIEEHLPDAGLRSELSSFLTSRAEANFNRNDYAASYGDYFEAGEVARKTGDSCSAMRVFYNIGMILYKQQQYATATRYFQQTLLFNRGCKPLAYRNNREQEVLDNIGLCYTKLKKYDSALYYYQLAQDLVNDNPHQLALDSINSLVRYRAASQVIAGNTAKVYLGLQKPDSAIALYKRSIAFRADLHDMQLSMIQLADIYLDMNRREDLQHLLSQFTASLDSFPAPDLEMDRQRLLYLYHKQEGNAATALQHFTSYVEKKDSAIEKQRLLGSLDIDNEMQRKAQELEIQLLQKNNELNKTYLWVLVTLSCMAIIILSLIYASYRTSRKNVNKLTELNQAITLANQEKDKILRMVAHDLRNPIGAIASLSNLILEMPFDRDQTLDLVKKIQGVSSNSIELINELLPAHTRAIDTLKKKRTDIVGLLRNAVELLQFRAMEKKQHIKITLPEKPVFITLNEMKIERVVSNLLVNAIKFSPVGGEIHLTLSEEAASVVISVQDNGIGIDARELDHIFDEFTSLKRTGTAGESSFGLGLSISRQIVQEEGGSIWAESSKGRGSVFYVRLNSA